MRFCGNWHRFLIVLAMAGAATCYAAAQAGTLDSTFASGGIFTAPGTRAIAGGVAIQADGKIVIAGGTVTNNFVGTVIRLNTSGTLDSTFGSGGIVTITNVSSFYALAIQPNGLIVAAGSTAPSSDNVVFLARLETNGTLDSSFGTGGITTTQAIPSGPYGASGALALQANGEILVAAGNPGVMGRFTSSGQLDTTFGTGGVANLAYGGPTQIVPLKNGKILVAAGVSEPAPAATPGIISRYNSTGSLDSTFGAAGMVASVTSASAMTLQSGGRIVVAGALTSKIATPPASNDTGFGIARYLPNGASDNSFGSRGLAIIDFGTVNPLSGAFALGIQSSGEIVAAGAAAQGQMQLGFNSAFALTRVTAAGLLDTTFGSAGIVTTTLESGSGIYSYVAGLAVQSNGDIVVAGTTDILGNGDPGGSNANVARYLGP
jgi:uncharacterized delta-60 repeat protein